MEEAPTPLSDTYQRLLSTADSQADRQLTQLEGWRRFVTENPDLPPRVTAAEADRLSPFYRAEHDQHRLEHHARLLAVATDTVQHVATCGRRLVLLNRHAPSARRGLIVSGAAGTGKTTAITQLGRSLALLDAAQHPHARERIPVVYITVPPAATPRMMAVEFARFLGLPVTCRANITDIIDSVCGVLIDARVSMVLIDEIHNISLHSRSGAEVSDTLKYFSERIPATFVYAGIDVESAGLFRGTRGAQIAGRFTLLTTHPFTYGDQWRSLVATLEDTLRLHRHTPGTLQRLDRFLHQRTGGMIGALSHNIRGAAIDAILSGTENITKKGIEAVPLDYSATAC